MRTCARSWKVPKEREPSTPSVYARLETVEPKADERQDRRLPRSVSSAAFGSRELVRSSLIKRRLT